jgi:hypothetical protein
MCFKFMGSTLKAGSWFKVLYSHSIMAPDIRLPPSEEDPINDIPTQGISGQHQGPRAS